jgi:hypothetical protein
LNKFDWLINSTIKILIKSLPFFADWNRRSVYWIISRFQVLIWSCTWIFIFFCNFFKITYSFIFRKTISCRSKLWILNRICYVIRGTSWSIILFLVWFESRKMGGWNFCWQSSIFYFIKLNWFIFIWWWVLYKIRCEIISKSYS